MTRDASSAFLAQTPNICSTREVAINLILLCWYTWTGSTHRMAVCHRKTSLTQWTLARGQFAEHRTANTVKYTACCVCRTHYSSACMSVCPLTPTANKYIARSVTNWNRGLKMYWEYAKCNSTTVSVLLWTTREIVVPDKTRDTKVVLTLYRRSADCFI